MGKHCQTLFWGGSKITVDGNCSHEIKRRLLLGRKVMTNLDSIFKSRDTALPTKVCLVKAMVFPVVMYGCESWTVKKAKQLNKFPNITISTREEHRGSCHNSRGAPLSPPQLEMRVLSLLRQERIPRILIACQEEALSTVKSRGTPGVMPPFQKTPKSLSPLQRNLISPHCLTSHTEY